MPIRVSVARIRSLARRLARRGPVDRYGAMLRLRGIDERDVDIEHGESGLSDSDEIRVGMFIPLHDDRWDRPGEDDDGDGD
jgi:hypothetical protein